MAISKTVCVACRHDIDAAARLCPFCGANPQTGERVDTDALLQEVFKPRNVATHESVLEFVRQRQGAVIAVGVIVTFVVLAFLHQYITQRNASEVSGAAGVPLTEVADLSQEPDAAKQLPLPDVKFQDSANARRMRTYLVEPGAVKPPEIVAAEQAAAQEALAKQQAAQQAALAKQQQAAAGQHPAVAGAPGVTPATGTHPAASVVPPGTRPAIPLPAAPRPTAVPPQGARPGTPLPVQPAGRPPVPHTR